MGKLSDLNAGIAALQAIPVSEPEIQETPPISVDIDLKPVLDALNALGKQLEPAKAPKPADIKGAVTALIKGLTPLLKAPAPVDLSPVVMAIEAIKFPEPPKPVQQSPVTFEIVRNRDGYMERVIATPGGIDTHSDDDGITIE